MDLSVTKRRSYDKDDVPLKKPNIDAKQEQQTCKDDDKSKLTQEVHHVKSNEDAQNFKSLEGFTLKRILSNNADVKRLIAEGTYSDGQSAVIILDKKPFTEDTFKGLFSVQSKLSRIFQNDIYGSYDCIPEENSAAVKATVVYPASQKHIEKYIQQDIFIVDETPAIYKKVVLPHLEESQFNIQWVFNILNHEKEVERIVFEDLDPKRGFVLLPDLKWDGVTLENLYLCGIARAKGIKSLRDLTPEHLPLLKSILEKGSAAIKDKYGLSKSQQRIYVHYQPSYYHLHVHFTSLKFNAPGIYAEKSHLLQTVIGNIEGNPNYYQEATLPFVVRKNDTLFKKLVDFGYEL